VSRGAVAVAALLGVLAAPAARAHEVLHTVERNRAIAVKAYFADGEALAHARYEIFSPSDPRIPHQEGWTDRSGWLAFVPDAPGRWRVRVVDDAGHGLDVEVDASEVPATASVPAGAPASGAAFALRPLAGLGAIGAVFAILLAVYRRKRRTP
jgi:nickel transport protein